ncbi:MAG TPA: radical SAM protein [Terriglobales bacterium]|nr:radical SAM protein [Terriglobales bacterium]
MNASALRDQVHPTRFRDLAVTVDFHCNSACTFCIVQEGMNNYRGVPFERFQQITAENLRSNKYDRVIFTGGEVTLEKSLFRFIEHARSSGAFRHIRLQTNGRKLADPAFTAQLVEAGVDEFFVSLHGDTAVLHDAITQRPGSFDELIAGLANLSRYDVRRMTNTVVHRTNIGAFEGIVEVAYRHGIEQMEFWNYLPMEDHADEANLIAPLPESMPSLRRALARCQRYGIAAVTKYVPQCLLGEHAASLDNSQPDTIIVETFWDEFPRFACLYEALCEHSDECLGLSHDYVRKFGWEESLLAPLSRTRRWVPRHQPVEGRLDQPSQEPPALGHPAWTALLGEIPAVLGKLVRVQLNRNQARYTLVPASGEASVELVVCARDDSAPALSRTRSFNIFYTQLKGTYDRAQVELLLRTAGEQIARNDDGTLTLDSRKGLVQLPRQGKERPPVV